MLLSSTYLQVLPKFLFAGFVAFAFLGSSSSSAEASDQQIDFAWSAISADGKRGRKIDFSVRFNGSTLCEYIRQFRGTDLLPDACADLSENKLRSMSAREVCNEGGSQDMSACFRRLSGLERAAVAVTNRFIQSKDPDPELDKAGRLYQESVSVICEAGAWVDGDHWVYESLTRNSCEARMYANQRDALSGIASAYQR